MVAITLNQDKKELVVGTSGGKLYRVLTNDLSYLVHTDSHTQSIYDISFGNEADKFACIDGNGAIKIWDLSEYKSVYTGYPSKQASGTSICMCKDDNTLVSGWSDGFIRCHDSAQNTQVWEMVNAHRGAVTSVYADSNYLLSGGEDGAVRVWQRQTRKLLI